MTIDTSAITTSVQSLLTQVFAYLPLGVAIIGVPSAIGIGIAFGGRIVGYVKSALGSGK